MNNGRMPDFIIVGAQKCGTTSMYHWLKSHPSCYFPEIKEPNYFSEFELGGVLAPSVKKIRSIESYKKLFAGATEDQICGEASPSYFHDPLAASRIAKAIPQCHCIVILRDPVERAHSQYLMNVAAGTERRSFSDAISSSIGKTRLSWSNQNDIYIELSKYATQIQRYYKEFPNEKIMVLTSHMISHNPAQIMGKVSEFLDIDPRYWDSYQFERHHVRRIPRGRFFGKILASEHARSTGRALIPKGARRFVASKVLSATPKKKMIDSKAGEMIWGEVEDEIRTVEAILGRHYPELWLTYPSDK